MNQYSTHHNKFSNLQTLSQVAVDVLSDPSSQDSQTTDSTIRSGTGYYSQYSAGSSYQYWAGKDTKKSMQRDNNISDVGGIAEFATLASTLVRLKSRRENTSKKALTSHDYEDSLLSKMHCRRYGLREGKPMY